MTIPRRWRLIADVVLAVAGIAIAVWQLGPAIAGVGDFGKRLAELRWPWLAVAIVLGVASLVAYGEMHRLLLMFGGGQLRGGTVQAITFVSNAVTDTIPTAGAAAGSAYAIAAMRRRGVDTTLSAWVVMLAGLMVSVTLLVVAPLVLSGAGLIPAPVGVIVSVLLLVVTLTTWLVVQRPTALRWLTRRAVGVVVTVPGLRRARWVPSDPDGAATRLADHILHLRPRGVGQWSALVATAIATWGVDYLALAACLAATDTEVPWLAVAVGYLAVQASIAVQLTPAGAGPAEAGLLASLLGGGVPPASAAITVVLYRSITLVGLSLTGWAVFLCLAERWSVPARRREAGVAGADAPEPAPGSAAGREHPARVPRALRQVRNVLRRRGP